VLSAALALTHIFSAVHYHGSRILSFPAVGRYARHIPHGHALCFRIIFSGVKVNAAVLDPAAKLVEIFENPLFRSGNVAHRAKRLKIFVKIADFEPVFSTHVTVLATE
jgi:hypothetical protein